MKNIIPNGHPCLQKNEQKASVDPKISFDANNVNSGNTDQAFNNDSWEESERKSDVNGISF